MTCSLYGAPTFSARCAMPLPVLLIGLCYLLFSVSEVKAQDSLTIVSYNVENLFDTEDDPGHADEEFLPSAQKGWTQERYRTKIKRTARVLSDLGGWDFPAIVGLCEVENDSILDELCAHSYLRKADYHHAIANGSDPRGINVALLWSDRFFEHLETHEILCPLNHEQKRSGRNILRVSLRAWQGGSRWEVFVLHAPSRRPGARSSSSDRIAYTATVRSVIDSLMVAAPHSRIIVLGDFNDRPDSPSLTKGLRAHQPDSVSGSLPPDLYNLSPTSAASGFGSHYFDGEYWTPDQIIVSHHLLDPNQKPNVSGALAHIFAPPYLCRLTPDGKRRPHRTYLGDFYSGGFSDHFPTYIRLYSH